MSSCLDGGKNKTKLSVVTCACHPSCSGKCVTGRLQSRLAWAKSETLSEKLKKSKRTRSVAQEVGTLARGSEFNPLIPPKKKKNVNYLIDNLYIDNMLQW
jgi:hypothetical protein